tara:strand:- start:188 stop:448 length:261 start_codon:yes stop_codon:yes gene_type:complete
MYGRSVITANFYFAGPLKGESAGEIISKLKSGSAFTIWESRTEFMAGLRDRLIVTNGLDEDAISLDSPEAFLSDLETLGIAEIDRK